MWLDSPATQLTAMNCACMSVGKPGYSVVRKFTPFGAHSSECESCRCLSSRLHRFRAVCRSPHRECRKRVFVNVTSPPVAATAHRKVPVSMRSESRYTTRHAVCPRPVPPIDPYRCRRSSRPFSPVSSPDRSLQVPAPHFPARFAVCQYGCHQQIFGNR